MIDCLGAISLLAVATGTTLSPLLAATQPAFADSAVQRRWFGAMRGAGRFATGAGFLLGYYTPLLLSTSCALLLFWVIQHRQHDVSDHDARRVLGWAIAFGVVAIPAFNVLTQDIWLSVAWGRMLNHGMNPFAGAYPVELAADLPLDYDAMPMTYGPWWAVVCSFAVAVGGGAPLASWLVLKLILGCAWVVCLCTVSEIARPLGARRRTLAIAVTGWLPLGMHCGVAEAHNDVVMVASGLLWARWMQRASPVGPLLLSVSILTKYVTTPLAVVDVVYHWRARTIGAAAYAARCLPAFGLLLAGAALVVLSSRGLSLTSSMQSWKFLDPADVFRLFARYTGLPVAGAFGVPVVALLFGSTALIELVRLARLPTDDNARRAQLAIMAVVLLSCTGHVWPWFFVWCLPFAALVPEFWLARFVIGAAVVAPFSIAHWWRFDPDPDGALRTQLPALLMYGVGLAAVAARRVARSRLPSGKFA